MWELQHPRFSKEWDTGTKHYFILPASDWRWDRIGAVGVVLCALVMAAVGLWYA